MKTFGEVYLSWFLDKNCSGNICKIKITSYTCLLIIFIVAFQPRLNVWIFNLGFNKTRLKYKKENNVKTIATFISIPDHCGINNAKKPIQ